ncbi:hypothetical protein EI94DRAFT_1701257 [Lactarius quietus]|nr:hypothetical protein EI94DRAFT_1701257 [Lactarius quietus]
MALQCSHASGSASTTIVLQEKSSVTMTDDTEQCGDDMEADDNGLQCNDWEGINYEDDDNVFINHNIEHIIMPLTHSAQHSSALTTPLEPFTTLGALTAPISASDAEHARPSCPAFNIRTCNHQKKIKTKLLVDPTVADVRLRYILVTGVTLHNFTQCIGRVSPSMQQHHSSEENRKDDNGDREETIDQFRGHILQNGVRSALDKCLLQCSGIVAENTWVYSMDGVYCYYAEQAVL